jgi:hypothetical protein
MIGDRVVLTWLKGDPQSSHFLIQPPELPIFPLDKF